MSPASGILAFCALISVVSCRPAGPPIDPKSLKYLLNYGYLEDRPGSVFEVAKLEQAVRNLQQFAGIPVTGKVDNATAKLMATERCGMKDNYTPNSRNGSGSSIVGEYRRHGTVWKKKHLTYRMINYADDPGLSQQQQRESMKRAFGLWEAVADIYIEDVTFKSSIPDERVDILVKFVRGKHSEDSYWFDGRGGTLAHAFYPLDNTGISGDVHFDDDEYFTTGTERGINFDWVAVHEIGHSLGLAHTDVPGAIMYPYYKGYVENIELNYDDRVGMQNLYGARRRPTASTAKPTQQGTNPTDSSTDKTTTTTEPTTQQPGSKGPDICKVRSFDTFVHGPDDKTYAVSGAHYWVIGQYLGVQSGPHKLVERFPGLPSGIDASFPKGSSVIFFKGSRFWKYTYSRANDRYTAVVASGQPMSAMGLKPALHDMDAAFVYRNQRTYLFKGDQYWRLSRNGVGVDHGYPRQFSKAWTGMNGPIDAVMTWRNGKTYYFKGEQYYRLAGRSHSVDTGYPQNTLQKWKLCTSSQIGAVSLPGNP